MKAKICLKCDSEKFLKEFTIDKKKKDGLSIWCKLCCKEYSKKYYQLNKQKCDERNKKYAIDNNINLRVYRNEYRKNNKDRVNAYLKRRREKDNLFVIKENIKRTIRKSFSRNNLNKNTNTQNILGCSFEKLKSHLESKFQSWMNWDNYGKYNGQPNFGWDIDHVIPLDSAKSEQEIIKLNHHTNLQPLCSYTNRDIKKQLLNLEV